MVNVSFGIEMDSSKPRVSSKMDNLQAIGTGTVKMVNLCSTGTLKQTCKLDCGNATTQMES
jgi:hypothetical protein